MGTRPRRAYVISHVEEAGALVTPVERDLLDHPAALAIFERPKKRADCDFFWNFVLGMTDDEIVSDRAKRCLAPTSPAMSPGRACRRTSNLFGE